MRRSRDCTRIAFLTGGFFFEAALLAAAYLLFLAFAFHGRRIGAATAVGFFVDHFTFVAALLFAAEQGLGDKWAIRPGF